MAHGSRTSSTESIWTTTAIHGRRADGITYATPTATI